MPDKHINEPNEVCGIPIPTSPSGRSKWPEAIKVKVVEQIAAGRKAIDVAHEIGANQSMVSKWVQSTASKCGGPTFVEVIPIVSQKKDACSIQLAAPQKTCQIQIGDTRVAA